jgi:hypothetical protein
MIKRSPASGVLSARSRAVGITSEMPVAESEQESRAIRARALEQGLALLGRSNQARAPTGSKR